MQAPEIRRSHPSVGRMWVVGESFSAAAVAHPHVWTAAGLLRAVDDRPWVGRRLRLAAGLGVDHTTWSHLWSRIRARGLADAFVADRGPAPAVAPHTVMRRRPEQVVIGAARAVSDHEAEAELVVPDGHQLAALDLTDWQHVPGILLIEAATQLLTWGAGRLPLTGCPGLVAVQSASRADFERFVFPAAVRLRLHLRLTGPAGADRRPFAGVVEAHQAGLPAARIAFDARMFDGQAIRAVEHRKARAAMPAGDGGHRTGLVVRQAQ